MAEATKLVRAALSDLPVVSATTPASITTSESDCPCSRWYTSSKRWVASAANSLRDATHSLHGHPPAVEVAGAPPSTSGARAEAAAEVQHEEEGGEPPRRSTNGDDDADEPISESYRAVTCEDERKPLGSSSGCSDAEELNLERCWAAAPKDVLASAAAAVSLSAWLLCAIIIAAASSCAAF